MNQTTRETMQSGAGITPAEASPAHTPGPWDYFVGNANGRGLIRIEAQGHHIASMPRGPQSEADAALIAAAPEMLELLELAGRISRDEVDHVHVEMCAHAELEANIRALIARITN